MKHIKRFNQINEEWTVSDHRDELSNISKKMQEKGAKEFYLVLDTNEILKYCMEKGLLLDKEMLDLLNQIDLDIARKMVEKINLISAMIQSAKMKI